MRCRDAQASRHDDDDRQAALRIGGQEQLAVDSDARIVAGSLIACQ